MDLGPITGVVPMRELTLQLDVEPAAQAAYEQHVSVNVITVPWDLLSEPVKEHWRWVVRAVFPHVKAKPPEPIVTNAPIPPTGGTGGFHR